MIAASERCSSRMIASGARECSGGRLLSTADTSTGIVACCSTFCVCEPSMSPLRPRRPCEAMKMRSQPRASAVLRIASYARSLLTTTESCGTLRTRATASAFATIARARPARCSLKASGDITRSSAPALVAPKSSCAWKNVIFAPSESASSTAWRTLSTESSESSSGTIKCLYMAGIRSERTVADDPGAFHLAHRRPVVLHGVVLRAAVVPDGDGILRPAPAHLVFGNGRLRDQVVQQVGRTRRVVLAIAHVGRRMEIGEVGREGVDEEDLLARLRMRAHDRV